MPLQERVRLEQEQILVEPAARAGRQSGECGGRDGQDALLAAREPGRAGTPALEQAQLVPEHEDLEIRIAFAPPANSQVNEECAEVCEYEPAHTPP